MRNCFDPMKSLFANKQNSATSECVCGQEPKSSLTNRKILLFMHQNVWLARRQMYITNDGIQIINGWIFFSDATWNEKKWSTHTVSSPKQTLDVVPFTQFLLFSSICVCVGVAMCPPIDAIAWQTGQALYKPAVSRSSKWWREWTDKNVVCWSPHSFMLYQHVSLSRDAVMNAHAN